MQPGDLVRITRASIAVEKDTIGIIVKARKHDASLVSGGFDEGVYTLFHVQLITKTDLSGVVRRYLAQDLRKIR